MCIKKHIKKYNIWDVQRNTDTKFYGGLKWVVDGENGRASYPGEWPKEKAARYYKNGWTPNHEAPRSVCCAVNTALSLPCSQATE